MSFTLAAGRIYIGQTGREFNYTLRKIILLYIVPLYVAIFRNVSPMLNRNLQNSERYRGKYGFLIFKCNVDSPSIQSVQRKTIKAEEYTP